ncbi:methyltransferase domain-containing protein [Hydrotalea sp.]|uniref:class I SAM-dependent methyltransferase n=1 Tax=Hydrotalea sp. TaxID=2881279 RepID=UPI0026140415|nr:methyltransferase domain-containing protein [Hydrotalea sp.]
MNFETFVNRKIKGTLTRWFGIQFQYPSETAKVRQWILPYCVGKGCDIGFGGDKVKKTDCDGIDYPQPYAHAGKDKVDIPCDVINDEIPVADHTYDYVYSSHLIEDVPDTVQVLRKFIRILKNGGTLILVFPNQEKYEVICNRIGQPLNPYHVHKDMSFDFMMQQLNSIPNIQPTLLFSSNCEIDYNVVMVLQIQKL